MSEAAQEVSGLAGVMWRAWRRRKRTAAERLLRVVETVHLGGRRQVHLMMCDGQRFLVGVGAESVQCIVAVQGGGSALASDEVTAP